MGIIIKSEKEIAVMREAGRIVAEILEIIGEQAKPGVTTRELDMIADKELKKRGAVSSFNGYRGFPANICASINDEIVHGIPGDRILQEGDIISLDFGAIYNGFQGDAAITVPVGKVSPEASRLVEATRESLEKGIAAARAGATLGDVSSAIQKHAESKNYSAVREYTGHGIGRDMHEDPQIPNYGIPGTGPLLRKGMTLALEPMLNIGGSRTKVAKDRWTVLTADGSLSAHFENTIAITDNEPEVLTRVIHG
jgi:methionyl aminopeptidase